jgi:hypothetical protein
MKIEESQAPVEYHYELRLVRIDSPSDPSSMTIQVNLPVGARIVHSYTAVEAKSIVSARNEGPALRAVPMLVALVDPRVTETQPRRFVLLTRNKAVASSLQLEPVAVFTSPDGQQVLAVLEEPTGATA